MRLVTEPPPAAAAAGLLVFGIISYVNMLTNCNFRLKKAVL